MNENETAQSITGINEPVIQAGQTDALLEVPHDHGLTGVDPTIASLNDELALAKQKIDELNSQLLRAHAEFQNLQKRADRDIANAHRYALERFLGELLVVVDSLEHGLSQANEAPESFIQGIRLTHKMFIDLLKKFGVERLEPFGQAFDPMFHEAMHMQENNEVAENTVLVVFQKGYLLNGRLLRPARVVVSKKSEVV